MQITKECMGIFTTYNLWKLKVYSILMQVEIIHQTLQKIFHRINNNLISCSSTQLLECPLFLCIFFIDKMVVFDYCIQSWY